MLNAVATQHGLTPAVVSDWRGTRPVSFELFAIALPGVLLMVLVSWLAAGRICKALLPGDRWPAAAGLALAGLAAAGLVLSATDQLSFMMEAARLGNGHVSFRAFNRPISNHPLWYFEAALAIWFAVAAWYYRQALGGSYASIGRTSDSPSNSGQ